MNYPVIPRAFFSGDCFDAYRILGAHPAPTQTAPRLAFCRVGTRCHRRGGVRRL